MLDDKNLRYNTCKILANLLAKLAEKDISMDEALCDKISYVMISDRITVRSNAALFVLVSL
jgi:ethanolamine ammonia-lyase small subunit